MQKLINDQWVDCIEADLVDGDFYRIDVNGGLEAKHYKSISTEDIERTWRDNELSNSDWMVPLSDHPQHAQYLTYRVELRDYPQQPDFPNGTRPEL